MKRKKQSQQPTDLEMQILSVLWERGPSPAREVLANMPDGKKRAYTSVLSAMQVMERKGMLSHTTEGNTHIFATTKKKQQVVQPMMRTIIERIFAGNSAAAVQYLIEEGDVGEAELAEIRKLINTIELEDQD